MNPFIDLVRHPGPTLDAFALVLVFLAMVLLTSYALIRNVMTMYHQNNEGGWKFPPFEWTIRGVFALLVLAIDIEIVSAFVQLFL